jgi:hypothetical protein
MTFPENPPSIGMTEWLDDFLLRSVLAGLIMVVIAAPMGCLMVWQRLAFLSDTLGHAAVFGVGIGLMLQVVPIFGVLAVALLIVFSLSRVSNFNSALSETTLAIISHTGLAGGIILVGLLPAQAVNLESILFGDLLATTATDLLHGGIAGSARPPLASFRRAIGEPRDRPGRGRRGAQAAVPDVRHDRAAGGGHDAGHGRAADRRNAGDPDHQCPPA